MNGGRLSLGLIALVVASAAHAKYVEIWNPPEARGHCAVQKPVRPHAQAAPAPASAPRLARKITEPDNARPDKGASSVMPSKPPATRTIPRKIGPDGNVFRV
ncbi:hypothetical protein J8I87_23080 [Paraburkholderia sp. LEh10]|uniref:hypothetical protein n=1 Tax=Paraburkholderia sp. LEh10 TaxID=2821353 RepID=UPI001AE24E0D|nr:hypothetical protein [Paraburkholderia sp. LEh10]MBP0592568.1 hypothetical protein [Paraburkholderia sp. LEh10]